MKYINSLLSFTYIYSYVNNSNKNKRVRVYFLGKLCVHVTFTNKLLASAVSVLMWVPHYLNTSVLSRKQKVENC